MSFEVVQNIWKIAACRNWHSYMEIADLYKLTHIMVSQCSLLNELKTVIISAYFLKYGPQNIPLSLTVVNSCVVVGACILINTLSATPLQNPQLQDL